MGEEIKIEINGENLLGGAMVKRNNRLGIVVEPKWIKKSSDKVVYIQWQGGGRSELLRQEKTNWFGMEIVK